MPPSSSDVPGAEKLDTRLVAALPGLRAYVARLERSSSGERDDLTQEVMARALRYRHAFDASRALGPWLRRTALRVFLDQRAERAGAPTLETWQDEPSGGARGSAALQLEDREELAQLLARLTAIERRILLGFHRDERSVRELAALHGLPEGTIKSHLHRARRKLVSPAPRRLDAATARCGRFRTRLDRKTRASGPHLEFRSARRAREWRRARQRYHHRFADRPLSRSPTAGLLGGRRIGNNHLFPDNEDPAVSTTFLPVACLLLGAQQQEPELATPATGAPSRVLATQDAAFEQRNLYVYDVRDIIEEAANRISLVQIEDEGPSEAKKQTARQAALEDLLAAVRSFVQPPLKAKLDEIKAADATTLLATVRPIHVDWIETFLEAQRVPDMLLDIQTRIIEGPAESFDRLFDRPSKVLANDVELSDFIKVVEALEGVSRVTAPRLLAFPRSASNVSVLDQSAYIKEYRLEIIQPGDELIVDPVIETIQDGFVIDMRAMAVAPDECGLDIDIHYSKTKKPIATKKVRMPGVQEPLTVSVPEVTSISVRSKALLAPGAAIVFRAPDPTGERDFIVMARVETIAAEQLPEVLEANGGATRPLERR